jgi:hypothetical protein
MRKQTLLLISFFCILSCNAQFFEHDQNCSTIIIGKDASASGCVMVAHNEDDGGNQIVNFYKLPSKDIRQGEFIKFKEGGSEAQASHTVSYLWFEMPGQDFADSYLNEHGVLITSNSCPSKELLGTNSGNLLQKELFQHDLELKWLVSSLKNGDIMHQAEHILLLIKMKHGCLQWSGAGNGLLREYPMIM